MPMKTTILQPAKETGKALMIMVIALCLGGIAVRSAPAPLVVALKPDKDPEAMLAERQGLAAVLSAEVGRPVRVIVPLSGAVIVEGLANGTIDVAYVSATDMLNARRSGAATLLLAGEIDGRAWYRSYWVALADKPYASVADLRGLPIAFASRTSTSGYVVPLHDLHRRGFIAQGGSPEDFFGPQNVWFGSGYVSAVERVLRGEAEAAAVSDYVLDQDKHLTAEQRARLRKVAEQGPVPTHVLAAGRRLSAEDRALLRAGLLALNRPEHDVLRQRAFVSRLVQVDESEHLQPLVEALAFAQSTR